MPESFARLASLFLLGLVCLSLAACANALRWRQYDYVVQPGDTLYSIAWHFDLDYRDIASWNHIAPPYRIYSGDRLVLNATRAPYQSSAPGSSRSSSPPSPEPSRKPEPEPESSSPSPVTERATASTSVSQWGWPAAGAIVSQFEPGALDGKGINISGSAGEAVVAAAGGRVVYSGSGLPGYGELIIIKHNKRYLSAYAHNRRRLVQEGDRIKAGDKIATMGLGNNGKALLHFEIRYDGKPVDPLDYLPARDRSARR